MLDGLYNSRLDIVSYKTTLLSINLLTYQLSLIVRIFLVVWPSGSRARGPTYILYFLILTSEEVFTFFISQKEK